jgi:hypothetical protein
VGLWIGIGVGAYILLAVVLGLAAGAVLGALSAGAQRSAEALLELEERLEREAWSTQPLTRATGTTVSKADLHRRWTRSGDARW